MDDFALLDRWRGGSMAAGNQLLERHFDALYRFFTNTVADLRPRPARRWGATRSNSCC